MASKIIITIKSAIVSKYGTLSASVESELQNLINSDQNNGISSTLIYLDDAVAAQQYSFTVLNAVSDKACKDIVDQLYAKLQPDYITIFGSQDIFPFQQLNNPVYQPTVDDDQFIPSDLPYACDAPYNQDCTVFTSPVRVVGRIPDVPNEPNVDYVTTLISNITNFKSLTHNDYVDYFAVTAAVWLNSSQLTTSNIFGNNTSLLQSPPASGGYTAAQLQPLSHFYNCHGALNYTSFYGQSGTSYPVSLDAVDLDGKIKLGTVVAAECCYGAQLLDSLSPGISIASNYLKNNAVAFLGSSTIAYGPATGQGQADLLCQYFMNSVLGGASTGRALLDARQRFLTTSGPSPDPYAFKTLAQFYLLGDPAVLPVLVPQTKNLFSTIAGRRMDLLSKGLNLGITVSRPKKVESPEVYPRSQKINRLLSDLDLDGFENELVFEVENSVSDNIFFSKALNLSYNPAAEQTIRFHVYQKEERKHDLARNITALVVKETNDEILEWKVYLSH
jgi:hypothetical protein